MPGGRRGVGQDDEEQELLALGGPSVSGKGSPESAAHRYGWQHATLIVVGEVLGTGIMGLPHAMISLGWVLGLGSCIFFAAAATYAGVLLSRVKAMYPGTAGYADMAHRLSGFKFGCFTNCAILFNWSFLLPYYLTAAANGLVIAFYDWDDACYYHWALLVMVFLLPALQIRTLHGLRYAALVSDVIVMLCIAVIVLGLLVAPNAAAAEAAEAVEAAAAVATGGGKGAATSDSSSFWPPPSKQDGSEFGILARFGPMASFVFAYQGHSMFLEIMREMEVPAHFPKAVYAANLSMFCLYLRQPLTHL